MGADGRFKDSLIYDQEDPEQGQLAGQGGSQSGFGAARPASTGGGQSALFNQTGAYQPGQGYQQPGAYNPNQPYNPNSPYGRPQSYASPGGRFRGADRARAVRQSAAPAIPGLVGAPGQPGASDPNDPNAVGNDGRPDGSSDPNQARYPDYSRTLPSQIPPGVGQRRSGAQGPSGAYGQRGSGIGGRGLAPNPGQRGQLGSAGSRSSLFRFAVTAVRLQLCHPVAQSLHRFSDVLFCESRLDVLRAIHIPCIDVEYEHPLRLAPVFRTGSAEVLSAEALPAKNGTDAIIDA